MKLQWLDEIAPILETGRDTGHKHSLVLSDDAVPVAGAFGNIDREDFCVEICYPKFTSAEAFKQLLIQVAEETAKKKCLSSILLFDENADEAETIKEILQMVGWSEPEKWMIRCQFDHNFNPPWLQRTYPLPDSFHIQMWEELTEQQISRLRHKGTQLLYPPNLSPFLYPNPSKSYSLCLMHKEEVIGWMMTRMVDAKTIAFDSFFIEIPYRKTHLILALLTASVKKVLESPIPSATMVVNLKQTNESYVNFVLKRYVPYLTEYNYILRSWKLIKH